MITLLPILLIGVESLITNSDLVSYIAPTSSVPCPSAFLEDESHVCVEDTTCSANYALTSVDGGATAYEPTLVGNRIFGNNSLVLLISMPAVMNRNVTSIVLKDGDAECNYPGPNWFHGVKEGDMPCNDVFVSNISWQYAAVNCGLTMTSNATTVAFLGNATVTYSDALAALEGVPVPDRTTSSVIQFEVEQPKQLDGITSSITANSDPSLMRVLTQQSFDETSGLATLTLRLSLSAPLTTSGVASITSPGVATTTASGGASVINCPDDGTTVCQQAYTFVVDPHSGCTLNGTYTFAFTTVCTASFDGQATCPIGATSGASTTLSVSVALTSGDLCLVKKARLALAGSLASFESFNSGAFTYGPAKVSFFQSQAQHFRLFINSTNMFPFATSTIESVTVQNNVGTTTTVFDANAGGAVAGFAYSSDAKTPTAGALVHEHHITFTAASTSQFGSVPRNAPVTSSVVVGVGVTFLNSRKRVALQLVAAAVPEMHATFAGMVAVMADLPRDVAATSATATATAAPTRPVVALPLPLDDGAASTTLAVAAAAAALLLQLL